MYEINEQKNRTENLNFSFVFIINPPPPPRFLNIQVLRPVSHLF